MDNATPYLKTDGTDWHDSPVHDCRIECPLCGYIGGPLQPHRTHPDGGWERMDTWAGDAFQVWVPPPPLTEDAAKELIDRAGETR